MSLFIVDTETGTRPNWAGVALIIFVIVAFAAGLAYWFASHNIGNTVSIPNQPSAPSQPGAINPGVTIGQITIPKDLSGTGEAQKITFKLASDWPTELTTSLKTELGEMGQVKFTFSMIDSSPYSVYFEDTVYLLDSESLKQAHSILGLSLNGHNLVPGQTITIDKGFMPGVAKTVTIAIMGFKKLTVQPAPAPAPAPTPQPAPQPAPQPTPAPTEWPTTIQTDHGLLTVNYLETDSAKGKINVWVDKKEKILYQQNRLDKPLQATIFVIRDGQSGSAPANFRSNETISQKLGTPGSLEFWYEVN